jgi:hypothetical protein
MGDRSDLGEIIYPRARQTVGGSAELGVSAEVQGSDAVRIRVLNEQLTGTGLTGQPRS